MAIYHFSSKIISRSAGRSAVAAAAYRSASVLHDERLGRCHDFTAKAGVVHSEILLPEGAPERFLDRAVLWNTVEAGERRKDSQLARDLEFSLPVELSRAEAIALARDFVREQFVDRGMIADLNVHWGKTAQGEDQPHAHVMLTMRSVRAEGFGAKVVAWNRKDMLLGWRERWAEMANERLCELGHDARIDHRSYAAQGIDLVPQNKIGPAGARRRERGEEAERAAEHQAIARANGERIALQPDIALDALTRQHSSFTRQDLARFVFRHTADAEQFASVLARVEISSELVRLGTDGRGRERFTSKTMLAIEQRMEAAALALNARKTHPVVLARRQDGTGLGDEQRLALAHVTRARDLAVVVGYAGTGKSTMLGVARQAWEAEGYRVWGAALSGIAAEGLEAGAGIESNTVHGLLHAWEKGFKTLTAQDVLVVDEAGMIGSRQMEKLLSAAQEAGAKVVLVGDPEQLQAIEAGAAFRRIAEQVGTVEITEVRRQRETWQQQATRELATGRIEAALSRYEAAGMVESRQTLEAAREALVASWEAFRRMEPGASQIMLAYRRDDVRELNQKARAMRREAGELGEERTLCTERGEKGFAVGDRVYFLRNDRGLGVKNGTLGTLLAIDTAGDYLTVRLDETGREVTFGLKDYGHIDHGYAATVHKSQGVTVDRAHVLASGNMDRHAAYVALTRHRDGVTLHWSEDEFGSRGNLAETLGRERLKDTSLDYAPSERQTAQAYAAQREFRLPEITGRSLRERLSGNGMAWRQSAGNAGLDRVRDSLLAGKSGLAEARRELTAGQERLVPGSLDWAADQFRQAHEEVRDYQRRFGWALPEQERALDLARERLDQMIPYGGEVLREALDRGRQVAAQLLAGGGFRLVAEERSRVHERGMTYRWEQRDIDQQREVLEQGWQGTAVQKTAYEGLARREWSLARDVTADRRVMAVLDREAPMVAQQARQIAGHPEQAVLDSAREAMRQKDATLQRALIHERGQSRGYDCGMGM